MRTKCKEKSRVVFKRVTGSKKEKEMRQRKQERDEGRKRGLTGWGEGLRDLG